MISKSQNLFTRLIRRRAIDVRRPPEASSDESGAAMHRARRPVSVSATALWLFFVSGYL
jgi:hypothetical protein